MKYSDEQRISKINTLTESLLFYLKSENIDREKVSTIEHVKWAVTTPLYNIGEHTYNLSKEYKESQPYGIDPRSLPVCDCNSLHYAFSKEIVFGPRNGFCAWGYKISGKLG